MPSYHSFMLNHKNLIKIIHRITKRSHVNVLEICGIVKDNERFG